MEAAGYADVRAGLGRGEELCVGTDQIINCGLVCVTKS